jgi:hypothetical protein
MKKFFVLLFATLAMSFMCTSCLFIKPYDKPEYVQIDTNETAFVIDLFADNEEQAQATLTSEDYYNKHLLNEKLVQIPHKWVKRGRLPATGNYIAKHKVVAVSNSPITGTWDDEIKVETKGSQGFTVPMKYAIRVTPQDSGRFLSKFPANIPVPDQPSKMLSSPEKVADNQFRNVVAAELSKEFHKYEYKDVLPNRDEIVSAAIERIQLWADEFGITIDNLAVWNGLIPDDATLQNSMDEQAKLAAQVETEKKRFDAEKQKKENEIELQKMEKLRIEAETENEKAKARQTVATQQILQQTSNFELDRKKKEQEIENLRLRGVAEADAIKIRAQALNNVELPKVITSNDLKVLGIDSLIQQATTSSK